MVSTTARGMPPRDFVIEEYTTTVCPHCFAERQRRSEEPDVFKDGMLVRHAATITNYDYLTNVL